jgi:hypothetical protein
MARTTKMANEITKLINAGTPRTLAILQVYGSRGKLGSKYKGVSVTVPGRKGKRK